MFNGNFDFEKSEVGDACAKCAKKLNILSTQTIGLGVVVRGKAGSGND
jgi:hypothetical protein